ncbi:MAG: hypothetical protein KDA68_08725, partial [Planctomycetaceae bacterium]|nr:hypothetical protein [Planctomycetaceae bacterium]
WAPIGTTGNANARLLAADPDTRIRFIPNAGFKGLVKIAFVAWDQTAGVNGGILAAGTRGGSTAFSAVYEYADLNVTNAAPVLNAAGTPTFDGVSVNVLDVNNPGTLVSDLISRMGPAGGITDADPGALQGIAIIGLTGTTNGNWQFTIDNGTTWAPIGTTGNANARLLAADPDTRIRFIPNAGFKGLVKIAFVAWDQTAGVNGGILAAGTRGGSTAFSSVYEYADLNVTNAAPVLNNAGAPTFDAIQMDVVDSSNAGTLISDLIARMGPAGGITDADPGALQGIAIVGLTGVANGTWQYTIDGGANWAAIGTTGNSNARLLASDPDTRIRYVPNPGYSGQEKIAFVAWDRTAGVNGGILATGTRGGSTAFSLDWEYAALDILFSGPPLI